jgi:hypothetical protein
VFPGALAFCATASETNSTEEMSTRKSVRIGVIKASREE